MSTNIKNVHSMKSKDILKYAEEMSLTGPMWWFRWSHRLGSCVTKQRWILTESALRRSWSLTAAEERLHLPLQ